MLNLLKIKPLFTKIVTTCEKYQEDQKKGNVIDVTKTSGTIKEYQRVVAVGSNPAGIEVGDYVMINPMRYAVTRHKEGSLKDGVITDNPVIGYNLPIIEINGVDHMLLETADVMYIIEKFEETDGEDFSATSKKSSKKKDSKSVLYVPESKIII